MAATTEVKLRAILEECRDGRSGGAFNEVVVMLESTAASAEVYMDFDDLRFTPDGRVVTLMVPGGTHMHLDMSKIREAEFIHTTNDRGLPSYQLWMRDGDGNPAMRIYLRKSDNDATNPAPARILHVSAGEIQRPHRLARRTLRGGGRAPVGHQGLSGFKINNAGDTFVRTYFQHAHRSQCSPLVATARIGGTAGVDHQNTVPAADQFLVGVAEQHNADWASELGGKYLCCLPLFQHQFRAITRGGYFRPRPLDVVDHADVQTPGIHHAGGIGQSAARLPGVLIAPHGQHGCDGLQVVQDAEAFKIAAVENEVDSFQSVHDGGWEIAATPCGVSVRDQANARDLIQGAIRHAIALWRSTNRVLHAHQLRLSQRVK